MKKKKTNLKKLTKCNVFFKISGKGRSMSRDKSGIRNPETRQKLDKMKKKMQAKKFGNLGKSGESDRHIAVKKPRHLYQGKRGIGKTDRR